jgi:hypothetical protein
MTGGGSDAMLGLFTSLAAGSHVYVILMRRFCILSIILDILGLTCVLQHALDQQWQLVHHKQLHQYTNQVVQCFIMQITASGVCLLVNKWFGQHLMRLMCATKAYQQDRAQAITERRRMVHPQTNICKVSMSKLQTTALEMHH